MEVIIILIGLLLSRRWREQLKTGVHKSRTPGRPAGGGGLNYTWGGPVYMDHSYGTCIISPFRILEFWGGCYIFLEHLCNPGWGYVVSRGEVRFLFVVKQILTLACAVVTKTATIRHHPTSTFIPSSLSFTLECCSRSILKLLQSA